MQTKQSTWKTWSMAVQPVPSPTTFSPQLAQRPVERKRTGGWEQTQQKFTDNIHQETNSQHSLSTLQTFKWFNHVTVVQCDCFRALAHALMTVSSLSNTSRSKEKCFAKRHFFLNYVKNNPSQAKDQISIILKWFCFLNSSFRLQRNLSGESRGAASNDDFDYQYSSCGIMCPWFWKSFSFLYRQRGDVGHSELKHCNWRWTCNSPV